VDHSVRWLFQILVELNDKTQHSSILLSALVAVKAHTRHTSFRAAFEKVLCVKEKFKWKPVPSKNMVESFTFAPVLKTAV